MSRDPRNEPEALAALARHPGFVHTGSGRPVYATGKVLIGVRSGPGIPRPTPRDLDWLRATEPMSLDAERLQAALLRRNAPAGVLGWLRRAIGGAS
jgi:hypothetical protein